MTNLLSKSEKHHKMITKEKHAKSKSSYLACSKKFQQKVHSKNYAMQVSRSDDSKCYINIFNVSS